jgi:hypothetical protein
MASRYFKTELRLTWGPNSDYSDPSRVYEPEVNPTLTPEAAECIDNLEIGTAAETLMRTDRYSTQITFFMVKNKDASNYVTVTWTDLSTTACVSRVYPGQILMLSAVNPGTAPTLQANGAAVLVDIVMCGES